MRTSPCLKLDLMSTPSSIYGTTKSQAIQQQQILNGFNSCPLPTTPANSMISSQKAGSSQIPQQLKTRPDSIHQQFNEHTLLLLLSITATFILLSHYTKITKSTGDVLSWVTTTSSTIPLGSSSWFSQASTTSSPRITNLISSLISSLSNSDPKISTQGSTKNINLGVIFSTFEGNPQQRFDVFDITSIGCCISLILGFAALL
ncbi:hypothetical protein CANARDRAFT_29530, partial [[Candida] arabinofermentans NRRL YB-2248]